MHVQMKENATGKDWSCEAGGVIQLPDEEGKRLVAEGHAVEVQPPPPPVIERAAAKLAQIGDEIIDVVNTARQETSAHQDKAAQARNPKPKQVKAKSPSAKAKAKKAAGSKKKKAAKAKAAGKVADAKQKAADKAAANKQAE